MSDLVPGGNVPLPDGTLTVDVPGPFDLSVLITGDDGKVEGDGDFVFFNQPSAPGIRLHSGTVTVDRQRLRAGASRVTVVISPADPGAPLGRLPAPTLHVTGPGGRRLARFDPPRPTHETVLLLAEIYRRGGTWKLRALGQGCADGLAGVARDFGVDVADDGTALDAAQTLTAQTTTGLTHTAQTTTAQTGAGRHADGFASLVNAERARAGAPAVATEPRLTAAAQAHAAAMARQGRLGAEGPDGRSVFQHITTRGYAYLSLAEHLVSGPRTPSEFLDYCLTGAETRRPLVSPAFSDVGLAHATDTRSGDIYWTALWARPLTTDGLAQAVSEVLSRTNAERSAARLPPLAHDPRLAAAAQAYSTDMATRGFYSHTSPEGLEPWDRARAAGCTHRGIGENIACGQRSPAEVVQGWMNSPGHRANILKADFTHLGIGFAGGGPAGTYWTQLFGLSA
ncbi:CAP domain-containing protein [Streptomyces sp. NPDC052236]|uniref:CAP domain-containing protein n=1 Tax=Streptomyces sp. NPDC052236 TaxID=3365686 RepID=UPI0037CFCDF6